MLLPRPSLDAEDELDPRAQLIRRLQEYERFKTAAENIDALPRLERDIYRAYAERPEIVKERLDPEVDLREVLLALAAVLRRAEMFARHAVQLEPLSVRERMSDVLARVNEVPEDFVSFVALFNVREGRMGVIVTFLAIMELMREGLLDLVQTEAFGTIYVRSAVS
jgi:segregation and condensation protein A